MLTKIFTFALVIAYAAAEIPSYINICGRKDPNLGDCIKNSINNLKDLGKICDGIPELSSPPFDPLLINNIAISDTDDAKLFLKDSKITGLCNFNINSLHMDIDKLHAVIELLFPQVHVTSTYDFDIRHASLTFAHKGPVNLTANDVSAKGELDLKMVTKNDKTYIYISKINTNLSVKKLNIKFDGNEQEGGQLNEIISTFIGSNEEEMINRVKPSIEKQITEQILSIGNNIVKHFTFDELFPDRE